MSYRKDIPKMTVGKYAGVQIDKLPNGYLRWMMTQSFPKEWLAIAKEKLDKSPYSNEPINVSRHCVDQFSLRFLGRWSDNFSEKNTGLGTFIASVATKAWQEGKTVTKTRHQSEGVARLLDGIIWVFSVNDTFPDYKEVITCYPE